MNTDTLPVSLPWSPPFRPLSFISDLSRTPPAPTVMSPLAPRSTTRWVNPAKEYDHRQLRTPAEASHIHLFIVGPSETIKFDCRISFLVISIFPVPRTQLRAGVSSLPGHSVLGLLAVETRTTGCNGSGTAVGGGKTALTSLEFGIRGGSSKGGIIWNSSTCLPVSGRTTTLLYRVNPYRDVPWSLCVPTPAVLAYHWSLELHRSLLRACLWQIVTVEWAVSSLTAFLHAARYRIQMNAKSRDWRFLRDYVISSPAGRRMPLPVGLIYYIRELGVQNIVRRTEYDLQETESLLRYTAETDWTKTPGFLLFDYKADRFAPIPRHPGGTTMAKIIPLGLSFLRLGAPRGPSLKSAIINLTGKGSFRGASVPPSSLRTPFTFPPRIVTGLYRRYRPYTGESLLLRLPMKGNSSLMTTSVSLPRCRWLPYDPRRPPTKAAGRFSRPSLGWGTSSKSRSLVSLPVRRPSFVAERLDFVMETFDQVDIPYPMSESLGATVVRSPRLPLRTGTHQKRRSRYLDQRRSGRRI